MSIITIGDSIATESGIGQFADRSYATVGAGLYTGIDRAFERAIPTIREGDTVLLSVGTNDWGIGTDAGYAATLRGYIDRITAAGGEVVLLGVRETGYEGGGYASTIGTPGRAERINDLLREAVAGNPDAHFSEESITAANSIASGEVHGNYEARFNAAMQAAGEPGAQPGAQAASPTPSQAATTEAAAMAAQETPASEPFFFLMVLLQALGSLLGNQDIRYAGEQSPGDETPTPTTIAATTQEQATLIR